MCARIYKSHAKARKRKETKRVAQSVGGLRGAAELLLLVALCYQTEEPRVPLQRERRTKTKTDKDRDTQRL